MEGFERTESGDRLYKISDIRSNVRKSNGVDPGLKVAAIALDRAHGHVFNATEMILKNKLGLKRRKVTIEVVSLNEIKEETIIKTIKDIKTVLDVLVYE